mmetsp:Transcript_14439/g.41007  ORF Transcript_14439/g.41007 Transcript_14439/m.41007 type:complete len:205 (-) Transcript_14439:246-860(-)
MQRNPALLVFQRARVGVRCRQQVLRGRQRRPMAHPVQRKLPVDVALAQRLRTPRHELFDDVERRSVDDGLVQRGSFGVVDVREDAGRAPGDRRLQHGVRGLVLQQAVQREVAVQIQLDEARIGRRSRDEQRDFGHGRVLDVGKHDVAVRIRLVHGLRRLLQQELDDVQRGAVLDGVPQWRAAAGVLPQQVRLGCSLDLFERWQR